MTFMPERDRSQWEYEPDPMGRLDRGEWRRRTAAADPFANEEDDPDPGVAELRRAWRSGQPFLVLTNGGGLHLGKGVGRNQPNERADVARLEIALARSGYYSLESTGGPTGYWGPPQEEALRRYQKDMGIAADGFLEPEQETHAKINEGLAREARRAPANQVAALGLAIPAAEAAVPALARILGATAVGGAAGYGITETARQFDLLERPVEPPNPFLRDKLRPPPGASPFPSGQSDFTGPGLEKVPHHTGNHQPPPKYPLHTGNTEPPPKYPLHTGHPIPVFKNEPLVNVLTETDWRTFVEVFPNQSDELEQATIHESRGSAFTEDQNVDQAGGTVDAGKRLGFKLTHTHGAYHPTKGRMDEEYWAGIGGGRTGSALPDATVKDEEDGTLYLLQSVTMKSNGKEMIDGEHNAAMRLIALGELQKKNVVVVLAPKAPLGYQIDRGKWRKYMTNVIVNTKAGKVPLNAEGKQTYYFYDEPPVPR